MGDSTGVWSLRLDGGVLIQCPRVIVGGMAGLCRLAWMPEDGGEKGTIEGGNRAKLLRVEASVLAFEPIVSEEDDNMMVGFYPPSLGSLRCDVLEKVGELEGASLEEREHAARGFVWNVEDQGVGNGEETIAPMPERTKSEQSKKSSARMDENLSKKIAADPRNALDL